MARTAGSRRISDVAELRVGYPFRGRVEPEPDGSHQVIQIRDVHENRRLRTGELDRVRLAGNLDRYLVRKGDVLFLSRGYRQYAVSIDAELDQTIASGYFYILTPDPARLMGQYLAWCINQPVVQAQLRELAKGSHMPFVARQEFGKLPIAIPGLEIQRKIVALASLQDRERRLETALSGRREDLIEAITLSAIRRDSHKEPA